MPVRIKRMPNSISIKKSQWGWTAYLDGHEVAHSKEKSWLESYISECVTDDRDG